jgi:DNA-binding PadR family transcriptional regulator
VYQITDAGREEFMHLLRQVWREVERPRYAFDIGVFFMQALSKDEIVECLEGRVAQLEGTLGYLEAHRAERLADPRVLRFANAIFDHGKVHLEAELAWTRDLLAKVEQGQYP